MYISHIRLENIRGFPELEIDLSSNRRTLIIGKNGTCKTSVLRAIALGLCDSGDANALISEPIGAMIYKDSRVGQIRVDLEGGQRLRSFLVRNPATGQERISRAPKLDWPEIFVCGYGAGRHGFGPESGRDYRVADAVYTLFDYRRTLIDPELTLRRLQDLLGTRRYGAAVAGIRWPWRTAASDAADGCRRRREPRCGRLSLKNPLTDPPAAPGPPPGPACPAPR